MTFSQLSLPVDFLCFAFAKPQSWQVWACFLLQTQMNWPVFLKSLLCNLFAKRSSTLLTDAILLHVYAALFQSATSRSPRPQHPREKHVFSPGTKGMTNHKEQRGWLCLRRTIVESILPFSFSSSGFYSCAVQTCIICRFGVSTNHPIGSFSAELTEYSFSPSSPSITLRMLSHRDRKTFPVSFAVCVCG